jgi:hypothetical protein
MKIGKPHLRRFASASFGVFLCLVLVDTEAACNREDVDFYTSRGFTTEQITRLCSSGENTDQEEGYVAYSDEHYAKNDEQYRSRLRLEREVFLRNAILATEITLRGKYFSYTTEECVSEGVEKDRAFKLQACPSIRVNIDLMQAEIKQKEYKEHVLFGRSHLKVLGGVEKKILGGLDHLKNDYERNILIGKIDMSGNTEVPLRRGIDFAFAFEAMGDIIKFVRSKNKAKNDIPIDDIDLSSSKTQESANNVLTIDDAALEDLLTN